MRKEHLITIITPSYNQGVFLEETILSVLNQDYTNFEYIIIDGGSSDNSQDIIRKYQDRLTYWSSEKDNGQSEAINKGFRRAGGDIVTWLCSDDLYTPGTLRQVNEIFNQHPDAALIHGKTVLFDNKGKEIVKGAIEKDLKYKYFSIIPFPQPSSFFSRNALAETGLLDESLHFAMDYDLEMRIAALGKEIVPCEDIFSRYRLHSASKTVSSQQKFAGEWKKVFSRFLNAVKLPDDIQDLLSSHQILFPGEKAVNLKVKFSPDEIRLIVCYFLFYQLVIYYDLNDKQRTHKLLSLIRQVSPAFYRQNNLSLINLRSRFIPGSVMNLLRKIAR